jgi:hypothetical protein
MRPSKDATLRLDVTSRTASASKASMSFLEQNCEWAESCRYTGPDILAKITATTESDHSVAPAGDAIEPISA